MSLTTDQRLSGVSGGEQVQIQAVPDERVRAHLLRIGMLDGPVRCRTTLSRGPVVPDRNGPTLAPGDAAAADLPVAVRS